MSSLGLWRRGEKGKNEFKDSLIHYMQNKMSQKKGFPRGFSLLKKAQTWTITYPWKRTCTTPFGKFKKSWIKLYKHRLSAIASIHVNTDWFGTGWTLDWLCHLCFCSTSVINYLLKSKFLPHLERFLCSCYTLLYIWGEY